MSPTISSARRLVRQRRNGRRRPASGGNRTAIDIEVFDRAPPSRTGSPHMRLQWVPRKSIAVRGDWARWPTIQRVSVRLPEAMPHVHHLSPHRDPAPSTHPGRSALLPPGPERSAGRDGCQGDVTPSSPVNGDIKRPIDFHLDLATSAEHRDGQLIDRAVHRVWQSELAPLMSPTGHESEQWTTHSDFTYRPISSRMW